MSAGSQPLDALRLPLHGSRLIEASAGTGKTWTIAALYLRLVLGHGEPDEEGGATAFPQPLLPSEILVMSFTIASTRELSDRIRQRLVEAAAFFRALDDEGAQGAPEGDDLLEGLALAYGDAAQRRRAAWRLAHAAEAMDDAAVLTIDAWCHRMLREHAFDSGHLFDETLVADDQDLLDEAARDYWRQEIYPLDAAAFDVVQSTWGSVDALMREARELMKHLALTQAEPLSARENEDPLGEEIARMSSRKGGELAVLKAGWAQRAEELRGWYEGLPTGPYKKGSIRLANIRGWLDKLKAWAEDPLLERLELGAGRGRFTPEGMRELCAEGVDPMSLELHPHLQAFKTLCEALDAMPDGRFALRLHAARGIARRMDALKQQAGRHGFKDLVERLLAALHGPRGEDLRRRVLQQFPAALIDEFQDTSPAQYAIFDALYRTASNDPAQLLLLIGDPKQSIYAFRGADIVSYLAARRATEGRHYRLDTNYRSTVALVEAVNALFAHAETRHAAGAFYFKGTRMAGSAGADLLPFAPVQSRGRKDVWMAAGQVQPALRAVVEADASSSTDSRRRYAARCAEDIVTLLNDPTAGFHEPGRESAFRRLVPRDIAVLVRSGTEAQAVQAALRARGVPATYLSDRDSVFTSREAVDLLDWLRAAEQPRDMRFVRAALATATLDWPLDELARLARDDDALDEQAARFRALQETWLTQGVLAMLRRLLHEFDLPARCLAQPGGERRLTNVLHLAELLQMRAAQLDGEMALVHWLQEMLGAPSEADEQLVRLESDAELVQIVTVHKSKGLEYPLVYVPFVSGSRKVAARKQPFLVVQGEHGQRRLDFTQSEETARLADEERLQEDLRLLYVALTRARHAVWVGVAALANFQSKPPRSIVHESAMGYLLSGGERIEPARLSALVREALERVEDAALCIEIDASDVPCTPMQPRDDAPPLEDAPAYEARFPKGWSVGSFSALVRHGAPQAAAQVMSDPAREEKLLSELEGGLPGPEDDEGDEAHPVAAAAVSPVQQDASPQPWHRFPRGAFAGNFLHDTLEWLSEERFQLRDAPALQSQLRRRCERQGHAARSQDVLDWMLAVTHSPLGGLGVSLDTLGREGRFLHEMEFWLPGGGAEVQAIDEICRKHLLHGRPRHALRGRTLEGMLMGFADLVIEHEGRYWVLDYKSNHLGPNETAYNAEALEAAMAQHRYDVQAALYLLALHRLLRDRLGAGYDPATQLGGAVYLFLRGFDGPVRGCHVIDASGGWLDALDALIREEPAG